MLQVGKGECWITGVILKDRHGVDLSKTGEGRLKARIKLLAKDDHGKTGDIYDPVFSVSEKIKQIVNSCGDYELKKSYKEGKIELEDLIGVHCDCVIGVSDEREGKDGKRYEKQNTIECYLRFVKTAPSEIQRLKKQFDAVEEEGEEIPF